MYQERKIDISDGDGSLEIAYLDHGSATRTLLCLHGIQGSKEAYKSWLDSPLATNSRLLIPDLPGFGNSQEPTDGDYNLSAQAKRLSLFLETLELEHVVVFGHSLGGMLGTILLDLFPDCLAGLISSEGNLTLADCGESRRVAEMSLRVFEAERFPSLQGKSEALREISAEVFFKTAQSVVKVSESEHLLGVIIRSEVPVLFIRGGNSHFQTEPDGEYVRNLLIPNENHFTLTESKELILAVEGFLTDMDG